MSETGDPPLPAAIAIGASAGGVEALAVLLPALAEGSQIPVFIVLHQPRQRPSLLVNIFSPRCKVPVREAEDKEPVTPGTVYFAPPDYHLLIDRGERGMQLALSTDAPILFSRPSVDALFESAADAYGPGVLGVILTGASRDGAAGLAAIGRAGGRTVVQDPATAVVSLMPEAAAANWPAAERHSLADIATLIAGISRGGGR
jgi:two-component system, chemotaxis family, protein-glutamate methylesterase/glutaminase